MIIRHPAIEPQACRLRWTEHLLVLKNVDRLRSVSRRALKLMLFERVRAPVFSLLFFLLCTDACFLALYECDWRRDSAYPCGYVRMRLVTSCSVCMVASVRVCVCFGSGHGRLQKRPFFGVCSQEVGFFPVRRQVLSNEVAETCL